MLRYWHKRINDELFNGFLLPCQLTTGESDLSYAGAPASVLGLCYSLEDGRVRVHIDEQVGLRASMLSTLLHEMVHQWQHQSGYPMNHGSRFRAQRRRLLAATGLTI
jgi:hypothetical protein